MKIGIIYGSTSGATAEAAKRIYKEFNLQGIKTELHDIAKTEVRSLE